MLNRSCFWIDFRRGIYGRTTCGEAKESNHKVRVPALIDVRAIRTKLGMTQEEFAGRFGFSVNTLRHWEQGKRQPEGPTRAYLLVIERAPKAVQKALHAA